mgnify:CR=1 FL=1
MRLRAPIEYRQDEIGLLYKNFDTMVEKINTLINENYINELLKKEAQIKAMESQMDLPLSVQYPGFHQLAGTHDQIRRDFPDHHSPRQSAAPVPWQQFQGFHTAPGTDPCGQLYYHTENTLSETAGFLCGYS